MFIKKIDTSKKTLIVAEIGNNHEGSFKNAKKLILEASRAGVDAVKFQSFKTEQFINKVNLERFKKFKSFELSESQFSMLKDYAHKKGLLFISTPFDINSAIFLNKIVDAFKVASSDLTFLPLIKKIISFKKPVIISTGLSSFKEIKHTIEFIKKNTKPSFMKTITLLHCISDYPVMDKDINLKTISFLKKRFKIDIGYSDHSIGSEASLGAVILGANIIEKHFTLDKNFSCFRDHQISADPKEMLNLVNSIRKYEQILGKEKKILSNNEIKSKFLLRRSIVSSKYLYKDKKLRYDDIMWTRPMIGIPAGKEYKLIGKKLKKDIPKGEIIKFNDLK